MNTPNKAKVLKGRGLLDRDPFSLGHYYLKNILFYAVATAVVLYWRPLFETVSFWWALCLLPLFLNRFVYIAAGSVFISIVVMVHYWDSLSWLYLAALPVALYFGHLTAVLIHNAVHYNFSPRSWKWLNRLIGEACALFQLSAGFPVFQYIHSAHHGYSDDLDKDPRPLQGYRFNEYVDAIKNWLTALTFKNGGSLSHLRTFGVKHEIF